MVRIPSFAFPHRARVVETVRAGAKDAQGERAPVDPAGTPGPWFPARRMSPRTSEAAADDGGRRRAEARWALLWGDAYEGGAPLTRPPRPSDSVEVEVHGEVFLYVVAEPRPFDTGQAIIGGQADLVEAGDSS